MRERMLSTGNLFSRAVAILIAALMLSLVTGSSEAAQRFEVPITRHILPDGNVRFTVPVRVGDGPTIPAMLDTGSYGLRILARALPRHQYEPTGFGLPFNFQSGLIFHGPTVQERIQIGLPGPRFQTAIQVVRSMSCQKSRPDCPASQLPPVEFGIGGNGIPYQGFEAILGLSLRWSNAPNAVLNPLGKVGDRRWIVILPRPGSETRGKLIINPDARDMAGFQPVALRRRPSEHGGPPQPLDLGIPNCPEAPLAQQVNCPIMPLDSGAGRGVPPFYTYAVLFDAARSGISIKRRD